MFKFDLQRFVPSGGLMVSPNPVIVLQETSIPATAEVSSSREGYALINNITISPVVDWVSISGTTITIAPTTDVTPYSYTFTVAATALDDEDENPPELVEGEFTVVVTSSSPIPEPEPDYTLTNFLGAWASAIKTAIGGESSETLPSGGDYTEMPEDEKEE